MNLIHDIPTGLKIEKFLHLKKAGRGFSQKLLIDHGEGIFTEEWFPVSFSENGSVPPNNKPDIDWTTVNWDKSDTELLLDLPGVQRSLISAVRKVSGHPKLGNSAYRKIDWRNLDWSKNNGQLSGELKIEQNVVANFRNRLFPDRKGGGCRVVTKEMIESVTDWAGTRDIVLAKLWCVSRERVRQIRQSHGFPRCDVSQWTL